MLNWTAEEKIAGKLPDGCLRKTACPRAIWSEHRKQALRGTSVNRIGCHLLAANRRTLTINWHRSTTAINQRSRAVIYLHSVINGQSNNAGVSLLPLSLGCPQRRKKNVPLLGTPCADFMNDEGGLNAFYELRVRV